MTQVGSIWYLKHEIRKRQLNLANCGCCNRPLEFNTERTKDHFWPLSLGGANASHNIWTMHRECNSRKGNRMPTAKETLRFSQITGCCRL